MRRCNAASSSSTGAARGGVGVVGVEARAEGPRGGGGGTTTPARDPPPENVRRRAGLGDRRETAAGVDARLAGLGDRRETEVGVEARRRRAAASAAPVAWRAMGDGDRTRRAAARGGEKKKPSPPRGDAFLTSATASRTADFISRRSPLLSRDRGDRGEVRRCGDRSCASLRSASSSLEQRRSS